MTEGGFLVFMGILLLLVVIVVVREQQSLMMKTAKMNRTG